MKFLTRFVILINALILFSQPIFAQTPDALANLLNGIGTMQADFVQSIQDNYGKTVQKSFGKMALERPGKFRWQVNKPIPQTVIANDQKLWILDPDLEQVTIKSLQRGAGETPALLLSHSNTSLASEFTIKQSASEGNVQRFSLTPIKKDSMFALIEMGFKEKQITEMTLKDHLGHTTVIQFKNIKVNSKLSSALFTYKAKPGVDVIDETKQR